MSEWIPISGEEWDGNEDGRWFVIDNGRVVAIVPDGMEYAEEICFNRQMKDKQWGAGDEFAMAQMENKVKETKNKEVERLRLISRKIEDILVYKHIDVLDYRIMKLRDEIFGMITDVEKTKDE